MPRNECFLPRNNGNRSYTIPRYFFGTKFRSQHYSEEEDGWRKERRENGHVSWRPLSDNVRHHSLSAAAGECPSEESSLSNGVIRLGLVLVKMFCLPEIRLLFHSTLTYIMHIFSLRIVTKTTLCITTPPQLAFPHLMTMTFHRTLHAARVQWILTNRMQFWVLKLIAILRVFAVRGISQWVQQCIWSQNKRWRSNSIFNLYG